MATKTKKANKSVKKTPRRATVKKSTKKKAVVRKAVARKAVARRAVTKKAVIKKTVKKASKPVVVQEVAKAEPRSVTKPAVKSKTKIQPARPRAVMHISPVSSERRRIALRPGMAAQQYAYMKAPGAENAFEVGDTVEVFCDHERGDERVRGWIKGIVVQVDNKMVAVQFRSNVFLTDGWMVPDRILWYPVTSNQIRAADLARRGSRKEIPDY